MCDYTFTYDSKYLYKSASARTHRENDLIPTEQAESVIQYKILLFVVSISMHVNTI